MRITVVLLIVFCISALCLADETVKVKQATIRGETIKVGQGADIVQSRIKADRFVASGYNYGDTSKGYYNDAGATHIITYGPPKSGTGAYVVRQIEKITTKREKPAANTVSPLPDTSSALTRDKVVEARRKYKVQVVSFDASQQFGTEFPYSDYVRLKVTNGSAVVLPTLTILTKRFDGAGRMIGSSRAPGISVADLKPGQSAEIDYYPRGHLPGVKKITVEVEALISPEDAKFFKELP
jgi:hypothetical protein